MTANDSPGLAVDLLPLAHEAVVAVPFVRELAEESVAGETRWRLHTTAGDVFRLRPVSWRPGRARPTAADTVLVGERFPSAALESFFERRINFIDGAGNLQLVLGDQYFAHVEGKRAPRKLPAMRGPAYQVLLAWLLEPDLINAPLRTTGAVAEVSRTPVHDMRTRLAEWGYIVGDRHSRVWTPRGRREARRMWLEGYRSTLRSSLDLGGYRLKGDRSQAANLTHVRRTLADAISRTAADGATPRCLWSGTDAVRHVAGLSTQFADAGPVVSLAVDPSVEDVPAVLPLVRSEHHNIRVRSLPIAAAGRHDGPRGWPPSVPHPLMVWTELMCDADPRAREAAEALAETLPDEWL